MTEEDFKNAFEHAKMLAESNRQEQLDKLHETGDVQEAKTGAYSKPGSLPHLPTSNNGHPARPAGSPAHISDLERSYLNDIDKHNVPGGNAGKLAIARLKYSDWTAGGRKLPKTVKEDALLFGVSLAKQLVSLRENTYIIKASEPNNQTGVSQKFTVHKVKNGRPNWNPVGGHTFTSHDAAKREVARRGGTLTESGFVSPGSPGATEGGSGDYANANNL